MYKDASKLKLRFPTSKGSLSVEQLWDLSIADLDTLAVSLQESYENSKGKSFIQKRTTKDKGLKLQFDLVLDILQTKVEEAEIAKEISTKKERNQKIIQLIAEKKDGELSGKSIKELEAMLED
ncbi:MAG TPA: hypothetical protein VN026_04530 [Bacteroidia bacterium]|jgi:hypothetical protein|nr:hypothetical protein [Bacteroidia bacterium]